jgi:hypothetical protein
MMLVTGGREKKVPKSRPLFWPGESIVYPGRDRKVAGTSAALCTYKLTAHYVVEYWVGDIVMRMFTPQ